MTPALVQNPLPSISGLKELYASITSNLVMQLAFNPQVAPYALGGDRSVLVEGVLCTLITTLIAVPSIASTLDRARYNGELPAEIPRRPWLQRLPRNRWGFAALCGILLAPLGGLFLLCLFRFYDFTSWTFYQFFWVKFAYLTLLGKLLMKLALLRFTQRDVPGLVPPAPAPGTAEPEGGA